MKLHKIIALVLLLLTLTGCSATVQGAVADPASALQSSVDTTQPIGEERAKEIALSHAGVAESDVARLRVEYEVDDGVEQYDVEFHQGGYEYAYEINAYTGAVISSDRDRED